jgi:hypothetical protein
MNIKFAVQIFFDIEFSDHASFTGPKRKTNIDEVWVRRRADLFDRLTLKSLLNQRFRDFQIWLLCGNKYRHIIASKEWHPRVKIFYDHGEAAVTSLDADYLVVTRLDSDDLMHRLAMKEISENLMLTDSRECLIFRKNYLWDMINMNIRNKTRRSPAFFTHIFPRKIFRNWEEYASQHFLIHEMAGGRDRKTRELRPHSCVNTFHKDVHQLRRLGLDPFAHFKKDKLKKLSSFPGYTEDPKSMARILEHFGIEYKGGDQWIA